jgi:WD40 repeat protein
VWDAATGADLLAMSGHDGDVVSVAWSPDGSKIAVATDGSDNAAAPWHGTVLIWDAATGAKLHTLTGHTARLDSVSWSPDGTKVVSASPIDESVRIWDAATGANLLTLTLPSSSNETSVAWSPDGTKLASTTNDKSILVWDSATGDTLLTLTGDTGSPAQLAWSPDGNKIAAGSFDRHMRVWDAGLLAVWRGRPMAARLLRV